MVPVVYIAVAFALSAYAIWRSKKADPPKRPYLYSLLSLIFCAAGIIAEIFTIKRRLLAGDIGGIEDTIGAVLTICIVFLAITAILNLLLLGLAYEKD